MKALRGNLAVLAGLVLGVWLALWGDMLGSARAQSAGGGYIGAPGIVGVDVQAWDADLDAIAALSTGGFAVRTGPGAWSIRAIVSANSAISVANGAGILGNPTLTFDGAAATALLSPATTTTAGTAKLRPVTLDIVSAVGVLGVVTNMPATPTEVFGVAINRKPFDATNFTQFRIVGRQGVAAAAGADVCAVFSADGGSTLAALDGTPVASGCDASSGFVSLFTSPNNALIGAWTNLATAAKGDNLFTFFTDDGDGVLDPTLALSIQFR